MPIIPGLMTVSYNLSFREGKMTPQRLMERVAELYLKSTEWCHFPCHEPGKVDWAQVKLLDRLGREKGIENSVAGWAPLLAQGDRRNILIERVKTQLEVSKFIGADRLRFHSSVETELGIGTQAPLDICTDNLKRVVELGEQAGIVIALEDHGDFRRADFCHFFSEIDSPFFGINLDTGNFVPLCEDVVAFAREFADKIVSCHFKAVRFTWTQNGIILTSCRAERSIVNLGAILRILCGSRREIPLHIEVIPLRSDDEDPLVVDLVEFVERFLKGSGNERR